MAPSLRYDNEEFKIHSFNENVYGFIDNYFVTLEIVERDKNRKEVTPWNFNMFSKRDIIPGRRAKKGTVIQVEDINPALNQKIVVYGSPGTGKTTLCKKIVYDFYKNGKMNNIFDEVILLQLRWLRTKKFVDIGTINELVAKYYFEFDRSKFEQINIDFRNCLFILDGWDEISELDKGPDYPNVIKLLKKIVCDHKVILTSRPNANMTHIFRHADQVLEIQGFNEFNARKYTKNVLNFGSELSTDDEANFLDFLSSVAVSDMMTIPIILDILLFTWEEIDRIREEIPRIREEIPRIREEIPRIRDEMPRKWEENPELTLTKLYEVMVLKLWNDDKKYKYKNLKQVIRVDGPLYKESFDLSKIARKCFEEGNLLFSWLDIKSLKIDCMGALVKSRFLNAVNANQGNEEWKQYEFIHLTFCEFFTALNYVLYTNLQEFRKIVARHKYNVAYKFVFGFVCGLISNGIHGFDEYSNTEMLNEFFDCLESEPFDLLRKYHTSLIVTCLNECAHNLEVGRLSEICKDFSDTGFNNFFEPITSLAVIENFVKNKNLHFIQSTVCRLPISESILELPQFSALDVRSKINLLCSSRNILHEAPKTKLKKLLHVDNIQDILILLNYLRSRIPDFFLIFIFENFKSFSKVEIFGLELIYTLGSIKVSLDGAKNVCAYLERKVENIDSESEILKKMILHSDFEVANIIFLRNVYEFMDCSKEVLLSLFNENPSAKSIRRIVYAIAMFNVSSPDILTKLMEIHQSYNDFRPSIVIVILHLYRNKSLPDHVVTILIRFLNKGNDVEEEHNFLNVREGFRGMFNRDIPSAESMYELVCKSLSSTYFHPSQLNDIISRLCDGKQTMDDHLLDFLSTRPLTDYQIDIFVRSAKIKHEQKSKLQANNIYFKNFCEKHSKNFMTPCPIRKPNFTAADLTDLNQKISELYQKHQNLFKLSWKFCGETISNELIAEYSERFEKLLDEGIKVKFSDFYLPAYLQTHLSQNQRGTCIAHTLLISAGNRYAIDIERTILKSNYKISEVFQDEELYNKLTDDDLLGYYYFNILGHALQYALSQSYLIQWITPDNIERLLMFSLYEPYIFTSKYIQIFSEINISSLCIDNYRLCSSNFRSKPLRIENLNFIFKFYKISKIDHPCRQAMKNAVSDIYTIDMCSRFYTKIQCLAQLRELTEKNKQINKFINKPISLEIFDFIQMLCEKKLINNSQEFKMCCAHFLFSPFDIKSNLIFGPYHLDLSDANLTDRAIALVGEPNIEEFLFSHPNELHILVLSNNRITINGFERLMKSAVKTKVKHLLLDGNLIYFDERSFEAFETLITDPNLELLTLDLSSNFIGAEWVAKLNALNNKNFKNIRSNVQYCLINRCRVIYQRNLPDSHKGFIPAIQLITGMEPAEPVKIDQKKGCFGYVYQTHYGYNGHVLIFIERMVNGQREMKTAELFKHKENKCIVSTKDVNPFVDHRRIESLKNRLSKYKVPDIGSLSNDKIEELLKDIENSQTKSNFKTYNVYTENQFENVNNCIKWANDILKPYVEHKIVEENIPRFYKIYLYCWNKWKNLIG